MPGANERSREWKQKGSMCKWDGEAKGRRRWRLMRGQKEKPSTKEGGDSESARGEGKWG